MKKALVLGAGGFIGGAMVRHLAKSGYDVVGVDIKAHEFTRKMECNFILSDLRDQRSEAFNLIRTDQFDEIYQFAADMGGAGYVFTGAHDADIMHNSSQINLNVLNAIRPNSHSTIFYSSSACMYPERNQLDPNNPDCSEQSAYPADPDSEYGWEKLFSERLYLSYAKNRNLNVRIARFHNIFGPYGTWCGGKEKAPAAICRKVAQARDGDTIEIWGDGHQTRSFLYIDECIEGVRRLMQSSCTVPLNIGSEEMVSINQLVGIVNEVAGKRTQIKHIEGPVGVRGRCSNNKLIKEQLNWAPSKPLIVGIEATYRWIESRVAHESLL